MKKVILETERTFLRIFVPEDLNDLHRLHSDSDVMQYLVGGVRKTSNETSLDLQKYIEHQVKFAFGKWATIHKASSEFMGRSGLVTIDNSNEIDLGYALHKKFWGQGYATEIAQALTLYGDRNLKAKVLIGLVKQGNQASTRVLEKIGFNLSGKGLYFGDEFEVYKR